jgi:hypothetical protein
LAAREISPELFGILFETEVFSNLRCCRPRRGFTLMMFCKLSLSGYGGF